MADAPKPAPPSASASEAVFPSETVITIYAESASNLAFMSGMGKFYLTRQDPAAHGDGETDTVSRVVAQIVMPLDGLINTYLFMEEVIADAGNENPVIQQLIESLRQFRRDNNG